MIKSDDGQAAPVHLSLNTCSMLLCVCLKHSVPDPTINDELHSPSTALIKWCYKVPSFRAGQMKNSNLWFRYRK